MNAERLQKYETWIRELERRETALAHRGPGFRRFFLGALVVSGGGFFVNPWIGVGTVFTGLMIWVFGLYVLRVRQNEYAHELQLARGEVARLRTGSRGES